MKTNHLVALLLGLALTGALFIPVALTATNTPGNPLPEPAPHVHTAPQTATVSITYDESISPTTVSTRTFAVHGMETGLLDRTCGVHGGTISLTPTQPFKPGELIHASATTGTLSGIDGTGPVTPTVWQFRSAAGPGPGRFPTTVTAGLDAERTHGLALGDLNGDGHLDLVTGVYRQQDRAYLNDGDGTFDTLSQPVGAATAWTYGLALGDVDGDGDLDLAVGSFTQQNQILINDGDGTFDTLAHPFGTGADWTRALAFGDVDGDGDLDLAVGNASQQNQVTLNDGDGTFDTTAYPFGTGDDWTYGLALGDVDGDGDLDLFTANFGQQNRVYLNDGDGTFDTLSHPFGPDDDATHGLALGDLDGDGDLDVATGNDGGQNRITLNDGDGTFDTLSHPFGTGADWTYGLALGDVDGDGDLDLAAGNDGQQDVMYLNDGDGTFDTTARPFGDADSRTQALALGDVDGDGDLDLAAGHRYQQDLVFANQEATDLAVTKSATWLLMPNREVTYTIVFSNAHLSPVNDVVITDAVPPGVTVHRVVSSGVPLLDTGSRPTYIWQVTSLAPGDGGIITLTGQVSESLPPGTVTNVATIAGAQADANPENNTSTAEIVVSRLYLPLLSRDYASPRIDLAIHKWVAPTSTIPGQAITYTIHFSNAGQLAANRVLITDTLPPSLTVHSVISQGVPITDTGTLPAFVWQAGTLAHGQGGTITITGVLSDSTPTGPLTNTVTIGADGKEENRDNNTSSAETVVSP